jgi:hypothetical protein
MLWLVTRGAVFTSDVEDAKSLPAEYQTREEPASPVVHATVAVVLAGVANGVAMTGAVRSAVVNVHVVVFVNPPKKLLEPSLNAVPGTVT